eukprot:scaffold62023_cov23-Cyclotella_meneghiniana.AAC.1
MTIEGTRLTRWIVLASWQCHVGVSLVDDGVFAGVVEIMVEIDNHRDRRFDLRDYFCCWRMAAVDFDGNHKSQITCREER